MLDEQLRRPEALLILEGLAPILIENLAIALTGLRKESAMAMILVEQQVQLAREITDRALVLDKGQVVWAAESSVLANDRERLDVLIGLQESGD